MTPEQFNRIADQIEEIGGVKLVNFYMLGEPFVNKHLTDFVKILRARKLAQTINITTNGTRITHERFAGICESGLDVLRISIYGATEESHKRITNGSVSLSAIKSNIFALRLYRSEHGYSNPHIYIKMIASTEDENAVFLRDFGPLADEINLEALHNFNGLGERPVAGTMDPVLNAGGPDNRLYKPKQVCPYPFYTLIIHSDLKVGVCCVDWSKGIVVGDLHNQTIKQVWSGEKLREIQRLHIQRRRHEIKACANCWFLNKNPDNVDSLTEEVLAG